MIAIKGSSGNCGIDELYSLSGTKHETTIKKIIETAYKNNDTIPALIFFSDHAENSPGSRLANYIQENKLGHISKSKKAFNKNSGNWIRAWFWKPINQKRLDQWFQKVDPEQHKLINQNYGPPRWK